MSPERQASPRRTRQISNLCAILLIFFAALCFQGHLTSSLTPAFSHQIAASIHPLNEHVFSFLNLDDEELNLVFAGINLVNMFSLMSTKTRKVGLLVNLAFYGIGLLANVKIGMDPAAHVVLVSICLLGFALR